MSGQPEIAEKINSSMMLGLVFIETAMIYALIVAILIIAAIITPTGDAFTLMIVSLPIWLLYELSVLVVKRVERQKA